MVNILKKRFSFIVFVAFCSFLSAAAPTSPNDSKLDELQSKYVKWTKETFSSFLADGKFDEFSPRQRVAAEKKALAYLTIGKEAGQGYYHAINELIELRSRRAVKPLLKIATERKEKDNRDRWMATRALGFSKNKSLAPKLIPLVYHYNQNTRLWAQISLVRLTGQNFGYDCDAWGKWWNSQELKPKYKNKKVVWTTRYTQYADPVKQKENDKHILNRTTKTRPSDTSEPKVNFRQEFEKRSRKDREYYTHQQLGEIEKLYQVANRKWQTQEAKDSLKKLLDKYNKANRTGCALLYMGQMSSGDQREEYLHQAIINHSDCWYGDGVNVGAYARYYLACHYRETGRHDQAKRLCKEILSQYENAIDHNGNPLKKRIDGMLR